MVHLDRRNLQGPSIVPTKGKGSWRMGDDGHRREMQSTPSLPHAHVKHSEGKATTAWLQAWNLTGLRANPPHATNIPPKICIHILLRRLHGLYNAACNKRGSKSVPQTPIYRSAYHDTGCEGARDVRVVLLQPSTTW